MSDKATGHNTNEGFVWGALTVVRICTERRGTVHVGLTTPKRSIQIRVTQTGRMEIWDAIANKELFVGD